MRVFCTRNSFFISICLFLALCATAFAQDQKEDVAKTIKLKAAQPIVVTAERHDVSPPLSTIPPTLGGFKGKDEESEDVKKLPKALNASAMHAPVDLDGAVQTSGPVTSYMPTPDLTFEGVNNNCSCLPPDTNGDVGFNQYVQNVNVHYRVWDKTGTPLIAISQINSLWAGFGGTCETRNDGDPVVLYDHLAHRWIISQFTTNAAPFSECVAVSTTDNPTGSYYRYQFLWPNSKFPDYPKLGLWPDGYYITVNQFNAAGTAYLGAGAAVFERDRMLNGLSAQMVYFDLAGVNLCFGGMLPSDLDGPPPPVGSPNFFMEMDDNTFNCPSAGSPDELKLWKFHVDWITPANSTFGVAGAPNVSLPTAAFDSDMCGYARNCIAQSGTTAKVDAISDRLMFRLAYRNFGDHESLVVNHTVDATGTDQAGIRWYEVRDPNGTPVIFQQGTYTGTPADTLSRWMGSAAMDNDGNIAIGYSASNASSFPSIRYAGRLAGDTLGDLAQGESVLMAGGGSQTHSSGRWGDYSMIAVDPSDDCRFWYTSEYYSVTSSASWQTRVGNFIFPSCTPIPAGTLNGNVVRASDSTGLSGVTVTTNDGFSAVTDAAGNYTMTVPANTYDVTASKAFYTPQTVNSVVVTSGGTTTQNFTLVGIPNIVTAGSALTAEDCAPPNGVADPGENVTFDFSLKNTGAADTTNLVATLLPTGGVFNPSGPQTYGALVAGGAAVTQPFTFDVAGSCGGTVTATLSLQDGVTSLGTVAFTIVLGAPGTPVTFAYLGTPANIPDSNAAGVNTTVVVSGITGPLADLDFKIEGTSCNTATTSPAKDTNGVAHTWVGDLVFKLTSPLGTTVTFISRPGTGTLGSSGNNICQTLLDDDSGQPSFATIAATGVPPLGPPYTGTFTPQSPLSAFDGQDPNGTWTLNVSDNAGGDTGSIRFYSLTITPYNCCAVPCPTITISPATLADATAGTAYNQSLTASGSSFPPYTFALTAGSLPAGLTLNNDGSVTGTPTANGTFNFTVEATDQNGCSGSQAVTLTVNCPTITISPATLADGTAGVAYNQSVTASGSDATPYTYSLDSGSLPAGLTLNGDGSVTGTPTATGTFNFTVMATDQNGCSGTQLVSLTILCPAITVSPATLPNGTAGVAYSQTVSASGSAGLPYTYTIISGSLPTGLTLNSGTGAITGTPNATGTFNFTVNAKDSFGCDGTQAYSVTINCPTTTVSPSSLAAGTVGSAYNQTVSASGSNGLPYSFTITAGSLPPNLALNATTGVISGIATTPNTFNFTVDAKDSFSCSTPKAYSITVTCLTITITPDSPLPNGTTGVPYAETLVGSGGNAPYTFSSGGTLPPGLTLDADGNLGGTPTQAGTFNFTVTATDWYECANTYNYTVTIDCAVVSLTPPSGALPGGATGLTYSQFVTASGGSAPYTYSLSAGALPTGLTLNTATGEIAGIPSATGNFSFDITVVDAFGCGVTESYTLDVNCSTITMSPSTLPDGVAGTAYSQTVTASGGTAPYTYALASGALPAGVTLNTATGEIAGTPTVTGSFSFDISATDAFNCGITQSYTLNVNCASITLSPSTLPDGETGTPYSQTVVASGGSGAVTYAVTSGTLPSGLSLNNATGAITGTPDTAESQTFTITATDGAGCTGSQIYTITIAASCLFCDDFEDGIQPGWNIIKPNFTETGGAYVGAPTGKKAESVATPVFGGCSTCDVQAHVQTAGAPNSRIWLLGWYTDSKNLVEVMINSDADKIILKRRVNKTIVAKGKGLVTIDPNVSYLLDVSFDGTQFHVSLDGNHLFDVAAGPGPAPTGSVGFRVKGTTGTFADVAVN